MGGTPPLWKSRLSDVVTRMSSSHLEELGGPSATTANGFGVCRHRNRPMAEAECVMARRTDDVADAEANEGPHSSSTVGVIKGLPYRRRPHNSHGREESRLGRRRPLCGHAFMGRAHADVVVSG